MRHFSGPLVFLQAWGLGPGASGPPLKSNPALHVGGRYLVKDMDIYVFTIAERRNIYTILASFSLAFRYIFATLSNMSKSADVTERFVTLLSQLILFAGFCSFGRFSDPSDLESEINFQIL